MALSAEAFDRIACAKPRVLIETDDNQGAAYVLDP